MGGKKKCGNKKQKASCSRGGQPQGKPAAASDAKFPAWEIVSPGNHEVGYPVTWAGHHTHCPTQANGFVGDLLAKDWGTSAEESTHLAVAQGIARQCEAWHMYVQTFQEVVNAYLRQITEWWRTWLPAVNAYLHRHKERDDRIEALIAEVAQLLGEVAAFRGTQDLLAIRLEATRQIQASTCNEKLRHYLLQVLREERAQIAAKFLQ